MKYIYIILGSFTLVLGLLGLITPGLPTTPLILLTGYLYTKGSPRLYKKLEDNKLTGSLLRRVKNGLSVRARVFSIILMWCMVSFTAFVVFGDVPMRYVMIALGVVGTVSQLLFLRKGKTRENSLVDEDRSDIVY